MIERAWTFSSEVFGWKNKVLERCHLLQQAYNSMGSISLTFYEQLMSFLWSITFGANGWHNCTQQTTEVLAQILVEPGST